MREITVATVQMKPALGESEDNLVKMSDFVSKIASQQKVDLIVFPELATSGYELGVRFTELAQRVPGPTVNLMAQRAAEFGVYIAFGMATKEKVESILFNSAVLVGPDGEVAGSYNKVHLHGEERMAFREGFRIPVFETEIGTLGLLLGWDLAFPEVARSLVLDGAELLCVMANWETSQIEEWQTYVRARAFENTAYVAAANRVGEDITLNFGGESMIVGPRGKIYASLSEEKAEEKKTAVEKAAENGQSPAEGAAPAAVATKPAEAVKTPQPREGYCVARIDLDEVRRCREEHQTLQARQPSVYRTLVRRY
jgi:predicted amidohydrolase